MRISTLLQVLSAATVLAVLAGCSGGSAIVPKTPTPQGHAHFLMGRIPVAVSAMGMLKVNLNSGNHLKAFNHCPATGPIVYISDFNNSVINIYIGTFAGQAPCGQLTSGLLEPQGLFVKAATHELYVANTGDLDVAVFRRGATSPFKTYADPNSEFPADVTVAKDGTVIATNLIAINTSVGSISTWHKDGTFVGNFPNPNGSNDYFLTVQKDGTVYWDDQINLWTGSCPAGACGSFATTGATFNFPGGLRSADGEDVVLQDQAGPNGGDALTYEPPNFGSPTSCALHVGDPVTFDINRLQHHYFFVDASSNSGAELDYPSCTLIGTVPGNPGGLLIGVAKDYPEPLN